MRKKFVVIFIALLLSIVSVSNNLIFRHLTTANGISQSEVYTFCEDRNGFMWFGTVDGLNRYDGYTIKIFNTDINNPHSLSNNTIRSLIEDDMGRLWIGTDDGLNYYDHEKELIYKVKVKTDKEKLSVWGFFIQDDQLLVGTNDGLWHLSIKSPDIDHIEESFQKVGKVSNIAQEEDVIRSIFASKHGGIWVITDNTISRIIFQSNKIEPIIIEDLTFDGFNDLIVAIEDVSGSIWIASSKDGIMRYNPEKKEHQHISRENKLFNKISNKHSALVFDNEQNLWVGTLDQGLICINYDYHNEQIKSIESIQNEPYNDSGLNSNLIYSLFVSRTNKLWVGTIGSGINIFDPGFKKFQHYKIKTPGGDMPNSNFIRAIFVDNRNLIWAGTHNNGLYLLDRTTNQSRKLGFNIESIFYIEKYTDNKYFICYGKGILLVEMDGSTFRILSNYEAIDAPVFFVTHSKDNVYWCATLNGLLRIRVKNNQIAFDGFYDKTTQPAISTNNCRVLFYDKASNQLLVGTEGGGLNYVLLDNECIPLKIKVYKKSEKPNALSNNYVRSIIQDKDKNTWIGTYEGLNKVEYDSAAGVLSFKTYTKNDGLPDNMIQSIVEDRDGFLWIGTNGGLSKFSSVDGSFENYNIDDGLQSNEFSEHTVFKTNEGEIFMGGINGITVFFPEKIKVSELKPRLTITDFFLNNERIEPGKKIGKSIPLKKSILMTDTLVLSPKQKNIGFKFSAMVYPNARKVAYAYKLEGFENDWKYTDAQNRSANYTNLRHGKYSFKVKATNTDGVWEDTPKEIFIHIQTPFAYTWIAYLLYVLAVVMVFLYFSYFTTIRYTTKKKLLLEMDHRERLHKLDELRTRLFINISHDLRTPLTLIGGPLDNILKDKNISSDTKENLNLIKRNVKRLNYLVEQLLDVRKAENGKLIPKIQLTNIVAFTNKEISHFNFAVKQKGLKLILDNPNEEIWVYYDPAMLSKVYFNLLSNAIKFSDVGEIRIKIERTPRSSYEVTRNGEYESYIKVEIKDTGVGMSKENTKRIFERFYQDEKQKGNGYGIGLSHTKELIDVHQGFIEAESTENVGTVIRFFIPENKLNVESENINKSSTEDIYISDDLDKEGNEEFDLSLKQTILVVEDNVDMLGYIKNGLKENYNVILARDGDEGLKVARSKMPDLIVSDVMMPKMDGIEFCKQLKTNIKTSHIPVILLTAKVDLKTKYEGIETGADDFITKPFDMYYLILRINNLLQSRESLRKLFQQNTSLEPSAVTVTSVDKKFLSLLMDEIEEGMSNENFSITSLESKLGMSHSSFYRKIKSLTGQSGQELLLNIRMKRARQILSNNKEIRVSEVAYMVGFTNPKYFSRSFKELFGYAPSDLKNHENQ